MTKTSKAPSRTGEISYFTYLRVENEEMNRTVLQLFGFRRNFSWKQSYKLNNYGFIS